MKRVVAVVGGGYAGSAIARALDIDADVVLVDPRDGFVNVAACLRALTQPAWAPNAFFPFDALLERGRHVRDRAVSVDADGVRLADGSTVQADFVVLATGSSYPYPARPRPASASAAQALADLRETHGQLAAADRVLLLGGGPVGLELAGEIHEVWPDKHVTVVDRGPALLPGFLPELADDLQAQLLNRGIELRLNTRLTAEPATSDGQNGTFTVTTDDGDELTADIWFRTYGVSHNTDYLEDGRLTPLTVRGTVAVDEHLRVRGVSNVYAVGDVADLPDAKMATWAQTQAPTVIENLRAQIRGEAPQAIYAPTQDARILLPLGTTGGVGQMPTPMPNGPLTVASLDTVIERKGRDLFTARFADRFSHA